MNLFIFHIVSVRANWHCSHSIFMISATFLVITVEKKSRSYSYDCGNRSVFSRENDLSVCGWHGLTWLVCRLRRKFSLYRENIRCLPAPKYDFSTTNQWVSTLNLHLAHRMRYCVYHGKINFVSNPSSF